VPSALLAYSFPTREPRDPLSRLKDHFNGNPDCALVLG